MTALEKEGRLAALAEEAWVGRPRLFAMYGLSHHSGERPVLGWGMEFEGREDSVFYLPAAPVIHHTVSAERVLQRYANLGDMHLSWF
jgi:hypothetical protein